MAKIWVIDDEQDVVNDVLASIRAMGHVCYGTSDPIEFRSQFQPEVDLVLLDIRIPGSIDGIGLLDVLKECGYAGKIIVLSGAERAMLAQMELLAANLGVNCAGTLAKPFSVSEATKMINAALAAQPSATTGSHISKPKLEPQHIERAIVNGNVTVYFQPQVCLRSNRVVGLEALVRLMLPDTLVMPDAFISVAEETGLIEPLTKVVLQKALRTLSTITNRIPSARDLRISINVPVMLIESGKFQTDLQNIIIQSGISQARTVLEVTESAKISNLAAFLRNIMRTRMNFGRVSLDDFGTGEAMLNQLKIVHPDEIKIDRSNVSQMLVPNAIDANIIQAIIELARSFGAEVVAEGVETREQYDALRHMNCAIAQGYYISKPVSHDEILRWLGALSDLTFTPH